MGLLNGVGVAGGGSSLGRSPIITWAVAAVAAIVAVVTVVVVVAPTAPTTPASIPAPAASPVADPAPLYGRWVRSGNACDTRRGDMVITAGNILHHEFGAVKSDMKLVGVAVKSPGVLDVKYTSQNGNFVAFAAFELRDADTLMVSGYLFQSDGIWRKC